MKVKIYESIHEDFNHSHKLLDRLDKITQASVKHFAKNFLSSSTIPDFNTIEIETFNRCNNDCPFCPANRNNDTRKPKFMDEQLFYSIIDQLHTMDYHGNINLFSNNEPLLDKRIVKFAEYTKKKLPNAQKSLYTNGILLNKEIFLALIENLDKLLIDNYNDDRQFIPPVEKVLNSVSPSVVENSPCEIEVVLRKKNQKLNTRAGSAPNRINEENKFRPLSPCILPFTQVIVRPDGTVAKCCNDPLTSITLGDLNKQTLREIWRGKGYRELRKEMYFSGRQNIAGCEFCDIFGLYNYLPPYTLENERKRLAEELFRQKNLGRVYIFDTTPTSKKIFEQLKLLGVELDGFINVRNDKSENGYNFVLVEQAVAEGAFILFPTPDYSDELFDLLQSLGYQYSKDYLIVPPELLSEF